MKTRSKIRYYVVRVVLPATWQNTVYTYQYAGELPIGSIVQVPFGRAQKLGVVTQETSLPDFVAKDIQSVTDYILPTKTLELLQWLTGYYPGTSGVTTQYFIPAFLSKTFQPSKPTKAYYAEEIQPPLTPKQTEAFKDIQSSSKPTVLHGVTGSGKTRVYAELALKQLKKGKDVLLLYPEISLTTQLKKTLEGYLGSSVVQVYHSNQKPTQQRDTWTSVHAKTQAKLTIGPRSALFLPHSNLGLVVIDEAHDGAYKQDSGTRYSALSVAGKLTQIHGAKLLLGSATPPVQETQHILSKGGSMVQLLETAKPTDTHGEVAFSVVDLRKKDVMSQTYLLSKKLISSIKSSLEGGGQSLIFLNRRGTARLLLCEKCGWHGTCPHCELPFTYHHDTHVMQCHICGKKQSAPTSCPDCNNQISQKTPGTKAIEAELARIFPEATVGRFDSDNKKNESFAENYTAIKQGNYDIILGTQLLTKGLDLPLLDTIGVLNADSSLLLPDYSSQEKAFQQLTQVSGRVGRGHRHGIVILQTYQPDNPLLQLVMQQDWQGFYKQELQMRQASGYPPFTHALKIWVVKPSRDAAMKAINKVADSLPTQTDFRTLGPAPSFYEKNAGKYSWQIVVLSKSRSELLQLVERLPTGALHDIDPISLL